LDQAEEVAARMVNKQRRQEGRAGNTTIRSTGNLNTSLGGRTAEELRNRARQFNISGRSTVQKNELFQAIRDRQ
tara:strand:+ start:193 stop:414 length:222 start_codon:yes stop_codon:yes gene_type:complete